MKTRIAVLAAGHGTRMKSETPKALRLLAGKPIVQHLLDAVSESNVDSRPIVVVGPNNEGIIKKALGDGYEYVLQETQLGSGDAVKYARSAAQDADALIVLYADHPFVRSETIRNLYKAHTTNSCPLTMATSKLSDFDDWRSMFSGFGRIVRNGDSSIKRIVETKDADEDELLITEINPGYFCLDATWLWNSLERLNDDNAQHEYYLTDLVRIAIDDGQCVESIDISPLESIGVNTPEHLEIAERFARATTSSLTL